MTYDVNTIQLLSELIYSPICSLAIDFTNASLEAQEKMRGGFAISNSLCEQIKKTHYYVLYEQNCVSSLTLIKTYWNSDYHVVYFKLPYENFIRTGINPFVRIHDVIYLGVHVHDAWYITSNNVNPVYDGIYTYAPWAWKVPPVESVTNSPILGSLIDTHGSIGEALSQASSNSSSAFSQASSSAVSVASNSSSSAVSVAVSSSSNCTEPGKNLVNILDNSDLVRVKKAFSRDLVESWKILEGCDWESAEKQDALKRKFENLVDKSDQTYPSKRIKIF